MTNKLGGVAQHKDLFKQPVIGTSAALPFKCSNSGARDRKNGRMEFEQREKCTNEEGAAELQKK